MRRILIFAGTTEGRRLAEFLRNYNVQVLVSTATEYGKACIKEQDNIEVISGRLSWEEMSRLIRKRKMELVLDATHPFAVQATEHIRRACEDAQIPCIRCLREHQEMGAVENSEGNIWVESVEQAAEYLKTTTGNVLISTGSKELHFYTEIPDYKNRCYARVLSTQEAVAESIALGFVGKHLIAMQGPFTRAMNQAMLSYVGAKYFVTKESGKTGGYEEKAEAAKMTGVILVTVGRPKEAGGMDMEKVFAYLEEHLEKR